MKRQQTVNSYSPRRRQWEDQYVSNLQESLRQDTDQAECSTIIIRLTRDHHKGTDENL